MTLSLQHSTVQHISRMLHDLLGVHPLLQQADIGNVIKMISAVSVASGDAASNQYTESKKTGPHERYGQSDRTISGK